MARRPEDELGESPTVASTRLMFGRDTLYVVAASAQLVLGAGLTPVITRALGPSRFGQIALAITVNQILGAVMGLGLSFGVQREYASDRGASRARGLLAVVFTFDVLGTAVLVGTGGWWGPLIGFHVGETAVLAAVWGSAFACSVVVSAILKSQDRPVAFAVVVAGQSVVAQSLGLVFVWAIGASTNVYLTGLLVGQTACLALGLVLVRPAWGGLRQVQVATRALRFSLPLLPQQLSGFVLAAGDRIVIAHELGSRAVGRYSVAYNIGSLVILCLGFLNQAWLPRLFAVADPVERRLLMTRSRRDLLYVLAPAVLALAVASPAILRVWAPSSFDPGQLVVCSACVACATFAYSEYLGNIRELMVLGRTQRAATMTALSAALNIALNLVLVPVVGITGSAVATTMSYVALVFLTRPPAGDTTVLGEPSLAGAYVGCCGVAVIVGFSAVLPSSAPWLVGRVVLASVLAAGSLQLLRALAAGRVNPWASWTRRSSS